MDTVLRAHREHVGRLVREARQDAGLTLDRLADDVGTSRQHLIKLEKGQHLARPDMLARIAAATSRPPEFFQSAPGRDWASGTESRNRVAADRTGVHSDAA